MLFPFLSQSQSPNRFSKLYDYNDFWQLYAATLELPNQQYLIVGRNIGYWLSDSFMWINTLNAEGDTTLDARIVAGDSSTYYIGGQAIVQPQPDFIYLAGTRRYEDDDIHDGYLMKLTTSGVRLWEKSFGGDNFDALDALAMNRNNELAFAGVSFSFGDSTWGNIYVVKTDTAGELIWQKSLGINNFPERCFSIDTTSDGGCVLAGIQGFYEQESVFVIKIDSLGNQKWKKLFGLAIGNNVFPRIRSLQNGDFLLTTALKTSTNGLNRAYISRLSPTGSKIWEKYYPGEQWHSWFGFSTELSDGCLVNAGGLMEFDSASNNYWVRGTLTKTDAQGNLLWQRKYYTTQFDNYFFCITPTSDAGFLMGGFAYRDGNYRQDAWAVKVDSLGCLEPGCAGSVAAVEPGSAVGLKIYPNPAADWLTVEAQEGILLGLRLSDMSGRALEDVQFFRQHQVREHRLSLAALPQGVYVLSVRSDKGWASEKVVKK
ncbi:MAG: hypothetical protein OHK0019_13110 [Saprospiraceae bacterium]